MDHVVDISGSLSTGAINLLLLQRRTTRACILRKRKVGLDFGRGVGAAGDGE
jgi:hypothetical protein